MNLEIGRVGDVTVVAIVGTLDAPAAPDFLRQVSEAIGRVEDPRVVFNLRRMPFVDSTGIGQVWHMVRMAREAGGDAAFAEATPSVGSLLEHLGMREVVPLFATEGEAVAAVARRKP